jgi:Na+/phosphate symporter
MSKNPTIEEILNFNFAEELDLELLPKEEQEDFNANLFGSLIERIIKRTAENLTEQDQKQVLEMIEKEEEIEKVFNFISERNENFIEEVGEEFLDFKTEIYNLLKK